MTFAYIPRKKDQNDGYLYFRFTEDEDEILSAPAGETFFVDEREKAGFEQFELQLESRYPIIDEMFKKYSALFGKRTTADYHCREVKFKINPASKIDAYNAYRHPAEFATYIKECGIFNFKNDQSFYNYHFRPISLKRQLNEFGIYVRPVRGTLEYNVKMAKKQFAILNASPATRRKATVNLTMYGLNDLKRDLWITLRSNTGFEINHVSGSYRKKTSICRLILVYIDLCNLFLKKNCYRRLRSFSNLKKTWAKMKQKEKMQYQKKFKSFMNKEIKINSPPKSQIVYGYALKVKNNTKIFSISKYEKIKFQKQLTAPLD